MQRCQEKTAFLEKILMPTDKMRLDMEWDFSLAAVVVETKRVKGFVLLKR